MSKEKIDKSELVNGCFAAILLLTALGLSIGNYFKAKELNHRLELAETNLGNLVEKLDKYQTEEREYVDVNDGELGDKIDELKRMIYELPQGFGPISTDKILNKLDKMDIDECSTRAPEKSDSDKWLGIVELWEQYKETNDGKLLAEWATQSLYDIIVKQFGTVNDNHEILHTVLRELVQENMTITHEGKEK